MTGSVKLELQHTHGTKSDPFQCAKSPIFSGLTLNFSINLVNLERRQPHGPVVPISQTSQVFIRILTLHSSAFRWAPLWAPLSSHGGLQLHLLQRSVPWRPSRFQPQQSGASNLFCSDLFPVCVPHQQTPLAFHKQTSEVISASFSDTLASGGAESALHGGGGHLGPWACPTRWMPDRDSCCCSPAFKLLNI